MKVTLAFVLLCACVVYALPTDKDPKAAPPKEAQDPKQVKDPATASKEVKDAIKNAKDAKKTKKECAKNCPQQYDPVCAHLPTDVNVKPITFGSQCAMEVHNCESGAKLVVKNKGECAGAGGVRLS
ncbi:agrin [Diprion similis]|uniref:agrin n=1 Tax=Diprion similis TaxID=362088 RepID=UPI001EF89CB9|nr:agrin [Diprion similis]